MQIFPYLFVDDGSIPNNPLPLLIYSQAIDMGGGDPAGMIEKRFASHGWSRFWRNGIYTFHHYHSTAHEVLGIANGHGKVQFGGENGIILEINAGDVIIVPAGVAHKKISSSAGFLVIGGYPVGQIPDMNYGSLEERPQADQNIKSLPTPSADPVYGAQGPLIKRWQSLKG